MSNKCPYCGAPAGKSHICPYAPGGKYYKAPAQKKPEPKAAEIKVPTVGSVIAEICAPAFAPKKKSSDPAVAAVADEIAKKKAAKAERQATREGKKPAMAWLDPETAKTLKMAAAKHGVTQEAIVAEGIAHMLEGKYKV